MTNTTLNLLEEDTKIVLYRNRFAELTGDPLSAILLQQIIHYVHMKKGKTTFYKFKEPCPHKLYTAGDSWCEYLICNSYQFDRALKIIGTKLTTGIDRKALAKIDFPKREEDETDKSYRDRFAAALKCCVFYWTTRERVTSYRINARLLGKFIDYIYTDGNQGLYHLSLSKKER